jgi:hypothetical protein
MVDKEQTAMPRAAVSLCIAISYVTVDLGGTRGQIARRNSDKVRDTIDKPDTPTGYA